MAGEKIRMEKTRREKMVKERETQRGKRAVDDVPEALAHLRTARCPVCMAQDAARQRPAEGEGEEERGEVDGMKPVVLYGLD